MLSLSQVQPRTPISSLPYTITNGGSYYLTGNLTGVSGQSGITVNANDVSIDLNGFNLTGVGSSVHGIVVSASVRDLSVSNGAVSGWGGNGVAAGSASSSQFQGLRLLNNGGDGLIVGSSSVAYRTIATGNTGNGIHVTGNGNRIEGNSLLANAAYGLKVDGTSNLIIGNNATGNTTTDYNIASGNNYGQILPTPGAGFSGTAWANFSGGCAAGSTLCSGSCVNTQTDPNNCGGCGVACAAGQSCVSGTCTTGCGSPATNCAGQCVNTSYDPNNCGGCGVVCAAGQSCVSGACTLICEGGTTKCGLQCVNTSYDPNNCGSCGHVCAAGQSCASGTCAVICEGGATLCGTLCVNTQYDPNNCGACAHACPSGHACYNGVCQ
jgi:hypothetical protein